MDFASGLCDRSADGRRQSCIDEKVTHEIAVVNFATATMSDGRQCEGGTRAWADVSSDDRFVGQSFSGFFSVVVEQAHQDLADNRAADGAEGMAVQCAGRV